jgi:hypothetical protein
VKTKDATAENRMLMQLAFENHFREVHRQDDASSPDDFKIPEA